MLDGHAHITTEALRHARFSSLNKSFSTLRNERAATIDRIADAELGLGNHTAAERLSRIAADLREASA